MTLDEYCAQLPKEHAVNVELGELRHDFKQLNQTLLSIAITHPHLVPWEVEITHEEF